MKRAGGSLSGMCVASAIVMLAGLTTARGEPAMTSSPPQPLGKGSVVVLRPPASGEPPADEAGDLLIHCPGAAHTIRQALERAGTTATVVVVNQPGLSAAYATPFREDPGLFNRLLAEPCRGTSDDAPGAPPRWRRVTLSCFSAGYGAVREILKTEDGFARVDAIVAADSIYAGIEEPVPGAAVDTRSVAARDMAGFVAFAEAAADGDKVFVVTHSAQPTPYASTTETADTLIAATGGTRVADEVRWGEGLLQASRCTRGGFEVLGFTGAEAKDHLQHLRSLGH